MIVLTVPTRLHRNRNYEHFRKPVSRGWPTQGSHSLPAGATPYSFWGVRAGANPLLITSDLYPVERPPGPPDHLRKG
ncbi:MAG: hypothetical protein AMXMBFR19_10750 [Chthonomonadaceae bacterium]|uniref:Uncharacterized protein n=1 Tax=Candidatus Nitrosymbiomonas proteolyticus TaxID=2608984 RepID=A0A809S5W6_9BACT|nr:hypothetical protein NPRO_21120 [Candidatus Nitrosymbiomonas proteolyticus]